MTKGQEYYKKSKEAYKKYRLDYISSPHGYAECMYGRMRARTRWKINYKGRSVEFTLSEFKKFLETTNFLMLLNRYLKEGRKVSLAPSADRINNSGNYTLDNLRIITHGENASKGAKYEQRKHGPSKGAVYKKRRPRTTQSKEKK